MKEKGFKYLTTICPVENKNFTKFLTCLTKKLCNNEKNPKNIKIPLSKKYLWLNVLTAKHQLISRTLKERRKA